MRRLHWPITDPSAAGDIAAFRTARDQIKARIEVLSGLLDLPDGPTGTEFHASLRMRDLGATSRFYAWLLNTWPKEWTHRYATFVRPDLNLNFVLMVTDGADLHHDTLYHLGMALADRAAVIDAYHRAIALGAHVEKPPRTTWKGTPLHELWLTDPDGMPVEVCARLTPEELAAMPDGQAPDTLFPAPRRNVQREVTSAGGASVSTRCRLTQRRPKRRAALQTVARTLYRQALHPIGRTMT